MHKILPGAERPWRGDHAIFIGGSGAAYDYLASLRLKDNSIDIRPYGWRLVNQADRRAHIDYNRQCRAAGLRAAQYISCYAQGCRRPPALCCVRVTAEPTGAARADRATGRRASIHWPPTSGATCSRWQNGCRWVTACRESLLVLSRG
jgi:hypothetical protein